MTAGKIPSDEEAILSVEFLTVAQVARWARVSTKTVYRWIEAKKLPAIKFGKRTYRIPTRAVKHENHLPHFFAILSLALSVPSYFWKNV